MTTTKLKTIRPLKHAGEFLNPALVEYAVISITMPDGYVPRHHRLIDYGVPKEAIRHLSVTSRGRLTLESGCYIESIELAEQFAEKLTVLFSKRHYRYVYKMKIEINVSDRTNFTTTKKTKDSEAIKKFIHCN
ncbi:hypothetical protein BIY22_03630 [Vibrio panuliri]|uniref:Uncharacterized protein n=1 Tax=Vibrio panuliri TaxID=1381081 RepID=A0A1Q9HIF8_9VIBR|nr:hypothetical protein [Vibrio panuliri]OLQ90108.1 hypothetical protein BIY22_03630 [Vibrio panuliri]